jgi:hypothetical protein
MIKIQFYRQSLILAPIVKYFDNSKEPHLIKIQTLIRQYESVLQKSLPTDSSINIISHSC